MYRIKQLACEEIKTTVTIDSETPRSFSSQNLNIQDIDTEFHNPQLVAMYIKDIYKYLHELEVML